MAVRLPRPSPSRLSNYCHEQIALSLTLLVIAGLFGRTLRNFQNIDLGFQRENVAIFDIDPTSLGYRGQRLRTFLRSVVGRARAIPGVRSAALSGMTPMSNYMNSVMVSSPEKSQPDLFMAFQSGQRGIFTTSHSAPRRA